MGDAAGVASSYRRFVEDHPTHDSQALWKNAAETLIRMGHQDMLEGLGGQSGWLRLVQDAANQARFQQLLEQQAHDEAWAWLDGQLEREEDQDQRASLLQKAGTLADRSGQHGRLMVFLDALERDLPESSELAQRTRFRRAQAMAANDRGAEAAEQLGELLAVDLPPELRRQALQAYGRTLGRQFEPADIESRIAALGTGGLTTAEAQELRHRAARQLLERGEPMGALTVLERLVDQPLESDLAEPVQEVLIRANVASGELDAALRIPLHYPSTDGSCQAWLFLVQNLPGDRPQAAQARDGALAACQPGKISVDKALILAGALAAPQPEQALAFLDSARQAPGLLALDRAKLDVQRAQVLASQGEFDQARVALQGILDQTDEPRIATRACAQLVRLARQETDSTAAEQASSTAQACVDRVESNRPAVKEIVLETVATLRALEAYDQAVVWQRRLVDAQPEPSEDRGYALLQLVHVELDAAGGDPSKADPSWLDHMAEAKGLATPDTHLHGELTTLELAWQVLQAHKDEARLADTLERAIVTSENGSSLLNSVAARLDAWKAGDAAKQVRAERGRRYPG